MPGNSRSSRRWLRDPLFLLVLAAALIAIVVQSGELGSSDTQHRENAAHALWTSAPPVLPGEYPEFGIRGRNGKLQTWYGIGQSLLLLPFDIAGTYIERLPIFADYNGNDPTIRNIVVSYGASTLLNVLTALVCFRFLRRLSFSVGQSAAGVLALLLLTTHLHYTQNLMENNYICLLTLAGFCWQLEWAGSNSRRALLIGSGALGLNLLTRLTTGLDLLACALFVALAVWLAGTRGSALFVRAKTYAAVTLPVYAFFILLDRLYQFYRFGSFFNTYAGIAAREWRRQDPTLPSNFPFSASFHSGFFGALFSPAKSIFLFDPLLILMLILAAVAWRRFTPTVKAYTLATTVMLLAYISFYARYFTFAGDTAWGDRYSATAVELAALLAIPLLLQLGNQLPKSLRTLGAALIAASALVQIASVAFWQSLERYQMESMHLSHFVIGLRLENMVALALGKMGNWGLISPRMTDDAWDYRHITTWNLLPFELRHAGVAPLWVDRLTLVLWWATLAALAWVLLRLRRLLRHAG
ncbi:MAG TPA: hypothetical protein VG267_06975 [Terracidiphilus sp.]|jgi:hypothetical protein|nr:hypothetical protein [Terracidiphilus sp.]